MRESTIEKKVCDAARRAGWLVHPKAAVGTRGWPDRTFSQAIGVLDVGFSGSAGLLFVEFKAPGKKPTKLQEKVHKDLRDQGYEVYVIDSVEAGVALFA